MQWRNSSDRYGAVTRAFHWISAVWVLGLFGLGYWMVGLTYYDPWRQTAPFWHKSLGVLFAVFLLLRLLWSWAQRKPVPLANHSTLVRFSSKAMHVLLYVLLVSIIVSGYLISTADGRPISVFGWFDVPSLVSGIRNQEDIAGEVHAILAWTLMGLVLVHALAALKHHFFDRDDTLRRMAGRPHRTPVTSKGATHV